MQGHQGEYSSEVSGNLRPSPKSWHTMVPPSRYGYSARTWYLFRDDNGKPGLLGLHCAHRAADLSYGRCEDGGLRCLYHGWLYDIQGNCIQQPGEPEGSDFKGKVKQKAYQ
ncbi:MAG: Rieske 2Fe-2S domain-containing protein, partial [SAR202 cluster bacterium]|nr:Rieske 2Fe-2S domain-containing protein [SAR202 cluster bacterium]